MVFTEQQLQVKKLVDVQQDIEIDALNNGVGALSSTMQNGFTEAANNFSDIQNSLEVMNLVANDRYNEFTGSVNSLSNAMTQGFLDMGNTVANVSGEIQGQLNQMNLNTVNMNNDIQNQFNGVNIELQNVQNTFELVNTNIGESINAYNEQITNSLSVDTLSANTLIYNVSAAPVASITALGYDSNGKVIPVTVIANSNLQLPPSANYIYTDSTGTPYAGMADTAVSTNENLVTSHAVYNAVNDIWTDLNEFHNEIGNPFGGIQNQFNDVNNNFNGIQSQFNDVNNSINDINAGVQNQFNDVNNNFNGIYSQFNDVNNNISDIDNTLYVVMNSLGVNTPMNYINSTSPVSYTAVQTVVFTKGNIGNLWSESSLLGNKYYDWNSSTNTLTFSSPTGIIILNSSMYNTFCMCTNLNQNILISNSVTNMDSTFFRCDSLNQNIYLYSDKIDYIQSAFKNCPLLSDKYIHIRSSIPMDTSNYIYNSLVNNITGVNWDGRIINDLPEPTTWPPVN